MHNLNKDTEIYFDVYFLQIISDIYMYFCFRSLHTFDRNDKVRLNIIFYTESFNIWYFWIF